MAETGKILDGRYQLVEPIGRGGMGTVYRARHLQMGKDFAVKVLRTDLGGLAGRDAGAARRLAREAEVASKLVSHPNCVQVTDLGADENGAPFLVMELVPGRSLAQLLAAEGRLAPARAVAIVLEVLAAIQAAHDAGVAHLDLKPENIIVDHTDEGDAVKILDFGIARFMGDGEKSGGLVLGTPEYLSPEQALGQPTDGRADLYAIGVVLYEIVAGRRPFDGKTREELISAHLLREPAPLPGALGMVVARALEKRVAARWQSAAELAAALAAIPDLSMTPLELGADAPERPKSVVGETRPLPAGYQPPAAFAPRSRRRWIAGGVAFVAAVTLAIVLMLRPRPPHPDEKPIRAALAAGDNGLARRRAESLARAFPRDASVFALLGHVLFIVGDRERALAAAREAVRLDRRRAASPELLADLTVVFGDEHEGEAAFRLAEQIGKPAVATLDAYAAEVTDPPLKRRAAEAAAIASRTP